MLINKFNPNPVPPPHLIDIEREWRKLTQNEQASFYGSFAKFREHKERRNAAQNKN